MEAAMVKEEYTVSKEFNCLMENDKLIGGRNPLARHGEVKKRNILLRRRPPTVLLLLLIV